MLYILTFKWKETPWAISKVIPNAKSKHGVKLEVVPLMTTTTLPRTFSLMEANEFLPMVNDQTAVKVGIEPYSYPEKHCSFCSLKERRHPEKCYVGGVYCASSAYENFIPIYTK